MNKLGIYIHVPFCVSKCRYCDFYSLSSGNDAVFASYRDALTRHFSLMAKRASDYVVDSIYFGGGTPSLLPHAVLCEILQAVKQNFKVTTDCEVTLETNPKTTTAAALSALRAAGFNRLSIGCQSACDDELKMLGRIHTFSDYVETVKMARDAGFSNISADLMLALPSQTKEMLLCSIEKIAQTSPEHISVYALKIEEGTWFGKNVDKLQLPDEDSESDYYLATVAKLKELGYEQYEISNFAKKGYESRHNLKYWHQEPYLGFGPAAYSFFEHKRYGYTRDLQAYIKATETEDFSFVVCDEESMTDDQMLCEKLMLGLRLCEGVHLLEYPFDHNAMERISEFVKMGLLVMENDRMYLTPKGMLLDNYITSDLLLYL
jgi:oxygen-independent coproporphyrinogen-3 oxidase